MGKSCQFIPKCRNTKTGEETNSKLFTDLLDTLEDRKETIEVYNAATSNSFLEKVSNDPDVKFDENGEITLHSLSKFYNLSERKRKILDRLNKEIGSGRYSYVEGLYKARQFNKSEYGDKYLATLIPVKNVGLPWDKKSRNQYILKVVENTGENYSQYLNVLEANEKINTVVSILENMGITVDFFDNPEVYDGRYSTENAQLAVDGLYHLIQVSHNSKNLESTFFEEAAHFAVASLHNTERVKRLLELCKDEEVIKALGILKEGEIEDEVDYWEAAGRVVSNAFQGKTGFKYGSFLNGIVNFIKGIFNKTSLQDVTNKVKEAQELAKYIADDFKNSKGSLEEALKEEQTLFDNYNALNPKERSTEASRLLADIQGKFKVLAARLTNVSRVVLKGWYKDDISKRISTGKFKDSDSTIGVCAAGINSMALAWDNLNVVLQNIKKEKESKGANLYSINVYSDKVGDTGLTYPNLILQAKYWYDYITEVKDAIEKTISSSKFNDTYKDDIEYKKLLHDIQVATKEINTFLFEYKDSKGDTESKNIKSFISLEALNLGEIKLKEILGKDYIDITGIIQKDSNRTKSRQVTARDLLTTIYDADTFFISRLLNTYVQMGDYTKSELNAYFREKERLINSRIVAEFEPQIRYIEDLAKNAGYNVSGKYGPDLSDLCAENSNGSVSNYFLNEWSFAVYHEALQEINDYVSEALKTERDPANRRELQELRYQFIKDATEKDDDGNFVIKWLKKSDYIPGAKGNWVFTDETYDELKRAYESGDKSDVRYHKYVLLEELKKYKNDIDTRLYKDSEGNSVGYSIRIPQISIDRKKEEKIVSRAINDIDYEETGEHIRIPGEVVRRLPILGVYINDNIAASKNLIYTLKVYTRYAINYDVLRDDFSGLQLISEAAKDRNFDPNNPDFKLSEEDIDWENNKLSSLINNYLFDEDRKLKKSFFESVGVNTLNFIFVLKALGFSAKGWLKNFLQANSMNIERSFSNPRYDADRYLLEVGKAMFTNWEHSPFGKRQRKIVDYINATYGRHALWELQNSNLWRAITNLAMDFYAKGDEIPQQALYMSALHKVDAYDAQEALDALNDIIISKGYDGVSDIDFNRILSDSKWGSRKNKKDLVDFFIIPKSDESGRQTSGIVPRQTLLKENTKEYLFTYLAARTILSRLEAEKAAREKADEDADSSFIKRPVSELFPAGSIYDRIIFSPNSPGSEIILAEEDENGNEKEIPLDKAIKQFRDKVNSLVYTMEDIHDVINGITSDSLEQQGLYYAGCKCAVLEDAEMRGMAIFMGYAIGAYNRNFNSGYNALEKKYKPSVWRSLGYSLRQVDTRYYIDTNGDEVKKNLREYALCTSICIPLINNIAYRTSIKSNDELSKRRAETKRILNNLGYTDDILRRMAQLGNDLITMYLISLLIGMLEKRNIDEAKKYFSSGQTKRAKPKSKVAKNFKGLQDIEKSAIEKILSGGLLENSYVLFDLLNQPEINQEKARDSYYKRFLKTSPFTKMMHKIPEFKEDPIRTMERFSSMLEDYAEAISEGKYESCEEAFRELCKIYGYGNLGKYFFMGKVKEKNSNEYDQASFDIWKNTYPELQEKVSRYWNIQNDKQLDKQLYQIYLGLIGGETTLSPKELKKYSKYSVPPAYFDPYDEEEVQVLADNLRGAALSGLSYDEESLGWKLSGWLDYFATTLAVETSSQAMVLSNLSDIRSGISVVPPGAMDVVNSVTGLVDKLINDDRPIMHTIKSELLNNLILRRFALETDDLGMAAKKMIRDKNASYVLENEGIQIMDGYDAKTKYMNWQKISK